MSHALSPCFFVLSESERLGSAVCREAGLALARLEERSFEGGEFKLRPLDSVRNRTTFVLEALAGSEEMPVSERFVRLLFLLNGLRDCGATPLIALVPYLAFARKDRRTQLRDPVNTRYVAQLLEASGIDRLVALDVHNPAALDNAFRVPVDHLTALPMMADHFATQLTNTRLAVASPDVGGIKRAQLFRELLAARMGEDIELAFIEKRRTGGVLSVGRLVGDVADRTVIVIDDLCATGNTLIHAADISRREGAAAVHVAVSHAPLPRGTESLMAADAIAGIVVTDSVGLPFPPAHAQRGKLLTLSIAPLFGQAVQRILTGQPLAPLLSRWPVPGT